MKVVFEWFKSLPPWAKILIILVIVYILYKMSLKIKSTMRSSRITSEFEGEKKSWVSSGEKATLMDSEVRAISDSLYSAMNSVWYNPATYGTSEEAIENNISKIKNNVDFLNVQKEFGVKDGSTLNEWIVDELSQSYIDRLNNILSLNDIKYRF